MNLLPALPVNPLRFAAKPVGAFFDVDGTLVQAIQRTQPAQRAFTQANADVLNRYADAVDVTLITGRSLKGFRETAKHLPPFPVTYLGLNNGQELHINPDNAPLHHWLEQLSSHTQDDAWKTRLKTEQNWDVDHVTQTLQHQLKQAGFQPAPPELHQFRHYSNSVLLSKPVVSEHGVLLAEYYPDQPVFLLSSPAEKLPPEHLTYGEYLRDQIAQVLTQAQSRFKSFIVPLGAYADYVFAPKGVSKGTLLQHIVSRANHQAIVVAGDQSNDLPMLTLTHALNQTGETVAVHPILSGQSLDFTDLLAQNPRALHAPEACNLQGPLEALFSRLVPKP